MTKIKPEQIQGYFIHIPRTAGKSIYQSLPWEVRRVAKHKSAWYCEQNLDRFQELDDKEHYLANWGNVFKFSCVRNPFTRLYSLWRYRMGMNFGVTFEQWIMDEFDNHVSDKHDDSYDFAGYDGNGYLMGERWKKLNQSFFLTDPNGDMLVDYVIRFENLLEDWKFIMNKFGFDQPLKYVMSEKNYNVTRGYRHLYTTEMVDVVNRVFAEDLKRFGYSFEQIKK